MSTQKLSSILSRARSAPAAQRWRASILVFAFAFAAPRLLALDDHNPIGVTGSFEGVITTGGSYNVLNHNATRQIDDIVVPGAIGKYGLKVTRYYNSRRGFGDGWGFEYLWGYINGKVNYPNGNVWDDSCAKDWGLAGPLGVSDWWVPNYTGTKFRLADGGTVVFDNLGRASQIIDPYLQTINIVWATDGIDVIEPGGRYLHFTISNNHISRVDAYDGQGHQIDYVVYHYTAKPPGGGHDQQS